MTEGDVNATAMSGAPRLVGGADFKGDPGGNVMAIGLFTAASGIAGPRRFPRTLKEKADG